MAFHRQTAEFVTPQSEFPIVAMRATREPATVTNSGRARIARQFLKLDPRRVTLFTNLRNINDATEDTEISGPSTPAHAQFRSRLDFGSLWTFGVKGTF